MKSFLLNKRPSWVDVFWLLSGAVVAAWLAPHSAKWFASNFFLLLGTAPSGSDLAVGIGRFTSTD
jgi:hypothetical protein